MALSSIFGVEASGDTVVVGGGGQLEDIAEAGVPGVGGCKQAEPEKGIEQHSQGNWKSEEFLEQRSAQREIQFVVD